jgi:hypothetical protein
VIGIVWLILANTFQVMMSLTRETSLNHNSIYAINLNKYEVTWLNITLELSFLLTASAPAIKSFASCFDWFRNSSGVSIF